MAYMDVTVLMLLLKLYLMSKVLLPLSGLHHCTDEVLPSQYTSHRILPIRSRLVSELRYQVRISPCCL